MGSVVSHPKFTGNKKHRGQEITRKDVNELLSLFEQDDTEGISSKVDINITINENKYFLSPFFSAKEYERMIYIKEIYVDPPQQNDNIEFEDDELIEIVYLQLQDLNDEIVKLHKRISDSFIRMGKMENSNG